VEFKAKFKYSTKYIKTVKLKSIKINNETYVRLLKLKASLTAINGEARTFDEAIIELLNLWEKTK